MRECPQTDPIDIGTPEAEAPHPLDKPQCILSPTGNNEPDVAEEQYNEHLNWYAPIW